MSISLRSILVALLLSSSVLAADAPVLSELRHAQAETMSARYDAADAKLKAAQAEMDRVKQDVQRFIVETRVDGYDLDIATLTYVKQPPAKIDPNGKPKTTCFKDGPSEFCAEVDNDGRVLMNGGNK